MLGIVSMNFYLGINGHRRNLFGKHFQRGYFFPTNYVFSPFSSENCCPILYHKKEIENMGQINFIQLHEGKIIYLL